MGRPLNKKFFGNRNYGINGNEGITSAQPGGEAESSRAFPAADDGIGGESIASVTLTGGNGYPGGAYLDKMPTIDTIDPPMLPGGVQAVASVTHAEVVAAAVHTKGTGYQIGDIIEQVGGTGTAAQYRVTKLRVVDIQLVEGASSQNFDGGENLVWDSHVNSHWTEPTIIHNIHSTGSTNYDINGWDSWDGGVWDGGPGHVPAPTGNITLTGGGQPGQTDFSNPTYNTRGASDILGGVGDNNGSGGTVTFTYGIEAVELVSSGDYTDVVTSDSGVTNITVGATGANATLDTYYGIKTITITQQGSGYTGKEAITFLTADTGLSETQATGTIVLTVDTGFVGSATNQENAIIAYVWQDGERRIADIVSQRSTRRYAFITSHPSFPGDTSKEDETVIGTLVPYECNAPFKADITATDSEGKEYWVTKLTAHKAFLTRKDGSGGYVFASGQMVPWTFDTTANGRVIIENA